jgi:hypothetical protein
VSLDIMTKKELEDNGNIKHIYRFIRWKCTDQYGNYIEREFNDFTKHIEELLDSGFLLVSGSSYRDGYMMQTLAKKESSEKKDKEEGAYPDMTGTAKNLAKDCEIAGKAIGKGAKIAASKTGYGLAVTAQATGNALYKAGKAVAKSFKKFKVKHFF